MIPGFMNSMMMAGAQTSGPRAFNISPAVSGKTYWDLDVDGPLVLTVAGSWTLTPGSGFAGVVELNGGGGGAGQTNSNAGTAGTASTFDTMNAGGGQRSLGISSGSDGTTSGGGGGSASGGDTNTTGSAGGSGSSSAGFGSGGSGGASPNGGATRTGPSSSSTSSLTFSGFDGNSPGGGGTGALIRGVNGFARRATGGGGGGGYVVKTYSVGQLSAGVGLTLIVGAGGPGGDPGFEPVGGTGADGRAIIT